MKRTSSRLLTPVEMEAVFKEAWERDGKCRGQVWPVHICSGFRHGSQFEFHHVIEQSQIKKAYRMGGLWIGDRYRPRTRMDQVEPEITAAEIARDPDLGIVLCVDLHSFWPQLTPTERLELVGDHLPVLTAAANRYSLGRELIKGLGRG